MKDLHDKFWIRKGNPRKKLTIAMDNCLGQNKNNVVLRLALYLVEMHYFKTVEFVVYIRGHTKNACDRLFNQMKLKYHKKDIFSWSGAIQTLDTKENVRIIDAQESMCMDYGDILDTFYDKFKANTIQCNHIFKVEHTDITLSMQCATHNGTPFVPQRMVKRGKVLGQERTTTVNAFLLEKLKPPCLLPLKQVELFKKFRPFIHRKYWDKTCPEPSEDVLSQVKNETATKLKNKTATTKPNITLTTAAAKATLVSETIKKKSATNELHLGE
jgi:hypothetical protein